MSSLTPWKARTLVLHAFLLLSEICLWTCVCIAFYRLEGLFFSEPSGRTLTIWAFALIGVFFLRLRKYWTLRELYVHMDLQRSEGMASPFIIDDVLNRRGHFPDQEAFELLKEDLRQTKLPAYPVSTYFRAITRGLIWPLCLSFIAILSGQLPGPSPTSQALKITLTPPYYLGMPGRMVDPRETDVTAYPGSLIRFEGLKKSSTLIDDHQRRYISRRDSEGWSFEARILSPLKLELKKPSHILSIKTIEDMPPEVTWIKKPVTMDFRPHSVAFTASDDHGLQETLVTVNGQEIEYAGDSKGRSRFSYRWDFDPSVHRPLMGGNVKLQISAYDSDRVSGPKRNLSPPLIWSFPGIKVLAEKTLKKVISTREATQRRLDPNDPFPASSLAKELKDMSDLLRDNPAISSSLLGLNQSMEMQFSMHARQDQRQPNSNETDLHRRHKWTLEMIEQQAQQILDTIEASEWVKRLQELSEKASKEAVSQQEWSEMYEELRKHFNETDTHPAFQEEMMSKFNQAELAAQMGDSETASKLLEDMAEQMRKQPSAMGASGQNPLAEKFQELLKELQDLITTQDKNAGALVNSLRQTHEIQTFRQGLIRHPAMGSYQKWRRKIAEATAKGSSISQELRSRDRTKGDPVSHGRIIQQLYGDISLVLTNRPPRRPWPNSESLPDDLQEAWNNILPTLKSLSGTSYPKEVIETQSKLGERGKEFRQDFESNIAPLLPSPFLVPMAKQAETHARTAHERMLTKHRLQIIKQEMDAASLNWKSLLQQLQSIQEAAQQAAGQQQQALRIGEDGKLQLAEQGQPQEEGDGRYEQTDDDIEIPLPDEFQSNRAIEDQLQESLRETRNEEEMSRFKKYMIDLLE